ncbi:c-type cytochrome [Pararhodobacter oceanensis]|uniref:c-type cytochrome n=1 Tax=Pararhodobacter oceanensis TaxID=2172121 RepID=UPI003A94EC51
MSKTQYLTAAAAIALLAAGTLWWRTQSETPPPVIATNSAETLALVEITLPETLSDNARIGAQIFANSCAACHGENATGIDGVGPPLVHRIYEPSHHGDESFQIAVAQGVRAHHWRFGNMAPVSGLTRGDVAMVIAYIRELQRANGIN